MGRQKIKQIIRTKLSILLKRIHTDKHFSYSLLYHLVDEQMAQTGVLSDNLHYVSTQNLFEQLKRLKRQYTFLSVEEHIEIVKRKKSYKNIVSVTIDDGYKASVDKGKEVFRSLNIPVTYFINTSIVENGMFWRDKVRYVINNNLINEFLTFTCDNDRDFEVINQNNFYKESKNPAIISSQKVDMALDNFLKEKSGLANEYIYLSVDDLKNEQYFTWGNHTNNHYVLSSLSKEEQLEEITSVEKFFEREGISYSNVFSIPFGNKGSFNQDTISILADLGYAGVVLSSGYDVKRDNELIQKFKKYNMGVINRFMPENKPVIL